ncbi:hypothetical protein [Acinetobacter sp. KS-LM10]|uniref:hypothetical protein n=1 Tax=Acinetobacter sp. KS-LM10 TaxID=3120518 RepID=UPI0030D5C7FC
MNAIPKFSEQIESIELARLTAVLNRTAQSLVELSDERDTVSDFDGHTIAITYVGRGFESIGLFLSNAYSVETRIRYMTDNLTRLTKIKNHILEEMAA